MPVPSLPFSESFKSLDDSSLFIFYNGKLLVTTKS